jgi:enolase-phosphatase E1
LTALPKLSPEEWNSTSFAPYRDAFPAEYRDSPAALFQHVQSLSASDIKDPSLKKLQGYLWRKGYESGKIVTPLFTDVAPQLKQWKDSKGLTFAIFSSGSVEAQKMFSKYVGNKDGSKIEDLNGLFDANYDTVNAGPKLVKTSYEGIARDMGKSVGKVLFLSDNVGGTFPCCFL